VYYVNNHFVQRTEKASFSEGLYEMEPTGILFMSYTRIEMGLAEGYYDFCSTDYRSQNSECPTGDGFDEIPLRVTLCEHTE
jgi:hypothetical protein